MYLFEDAVKQKKKTFFEKYGKMIEEVFDIKDLLNHNHKLFH